jgi:hypothetical protein
MTALPAGGDNPRLPDELETVTYVYGECYSQSGIEKSEVASGV